MGQRLDVRSRWPRWKMHRRWRTLSPAAISAFILPAKDVGRLAAKLIREDWTGTRIVELEGPSRITPHDLAQSFTRVIGKPVRAVPVPRESWAALFRSQGMRNPRTPHANALLQDVGLIHLFPLSFFLLPFLRCCSILLRIILQLQLAVTPARRENISILSVEITLFIWEYIVEVGVITKTKYAGFPPSRI